MQPVVVETAVLVAETAAETCRLNGWPARRLWMVVFVLD